MGHMHKLTLLMVPKAMAEKQQGTIEVHGVSPPGGNSLMGESPLDKGMVLVETSHLFPGRPDLNNNTETVLITTLFG